jgi:hypothetical protein
LYEERATGAHASFLLLFSSAAFQVLEHNFNPEMSVLIEEMLKVSGGSNEQF